MKMSLTVYSDFEDGTGFGTKTLEINSRDPNNNYQLKYSTLMSLQHSTQRQPTSGSATRVLQQAGFLCKYQHKCTNAHTIPTYSDLVCLDLWPHKRNNLFLEFVRNATTTTTTTEASSICELLQRTINRTASRSAILQSTTVRYLLLFPPETCLYLRRSHT